MKIIFDWYLLIRKLRILFLLSVLYALYTYVAPVWAFIVFAGILLNDISDIEVDVSDLKESEDKWRSIASSKRSF